MHHGVSGGRMVQAEGSIHERMLSSTESSVAKGVSEGLVRVRPGRSWEPDPVGPAHHPATLILL